MEGEGTKRDGDYIVKSAMQERIGQNQKTELGWIRIFRFPYHNGGIARERDCKDDTEYLQFAQQTSRFQRSS